MSEEDLLGMDELAERAGVSRRTVRYYVQRGLLPPPQGLGRGKHYAPAHLATLIRIRELQEAGVALEEIGARLAGESGATHAPHATPAGTSVARPLPAEAPVAVTQTAWSRVSLSEELEVHVRGRRLTEEQIRKLVRAVRNIVEGTS